MTAEPPPDSETVWRAIAQHGTLSALHDEARREVYLDTPTAELRAAGLAARCTTAAGRIRIEVVAVPITPSQMPAVESITTEVEGDTQLGRAVASLVRERLGLTITADAEPILELHTRTERQRLRTDTAEVDLVLDRVAVSLPEERTAGEFLAFSLHPHDGDDDGLQALATALLKIPPLRPTPGSAHERARTLVGLAGYTYPEAAPHFDHTASIGRVARQFCLAQLRTMQAHTVGARVGLDPEHVHRSRVAIRRTRAALRLFSHAFESAERESVDAELKWITGVLGDVRDLDVHRLALPRWRERLGADPSRGWDALANAVREQRQAAHRHMLDAMDSPRYANACRDAELLFGATTFASAPEQARMAIGPALGTLMRRPVRRFERSLARFHRTRSLDDAHALRISAKGLRYGTELLRPLLRRKAWRRARRLREFQDALGDLQDAGQAGALAHRLSSDALTRDTHAAYAIVLGRLEGWAVATTARVSNIVDAALAELDAPGLIDALR